MRLILALTATDASTNSDRSATLFGANYPKLQALKKKYDPDVVFNKWFPIIPA